MMGLPVHFDVLKHPDARVLLFTAVTALLTGLLCGAAPAMSASNAMPASALLPGSKIGETKRQRLFGKGLVAAQVAISLVLVSLAGLFVGYLAQLRNNLGFECNNLSFSEMSPMEGPGAASFAAADDHPDKTTAVSMNYIAPSYFETYGTPFLAGRDFSGRDQAGSRVAIINESAARNCFGNENPIGRHITLSHITMTEGEKTFVHAWR